MKRRRMKITVIISRLIIQKKAAGPEAVRKRGFDEELVVVVELVKELAVEVPAEELHLPILAQAVNLPD
jgi:hypothetical protein